jgi:basic membrane protein A
MNTPFKRSKFSILVLALNLFAHAQICAAEGRIALVLDKGGKDDKSFNAAAFQGVMKVKDETKAFVKYVEATDDNAFEPLLRAFAQKNFDLIIAVGVSQTDAMKKVAPQFPNQHFAIVDGEVKAPNVRSLLFEEQEGSFVVGAIAATTSKTGKVGFIGGMDIPLIRRFQLGFETGAKHVNPRIKVTSNYVGVTADAWNNPAKEKELAVSQFDSGVDVIFSAAGASGAGLFDAAEEKKKLAIGVDSNQDWVKPGFILTSMVKRVDQAVYSTCKDVFDKKFTAGIQRYGVANQGVDYTVDSYNEKVLSLAARKKADEIKAGIISGKILVPDYYKNKK